MASLCTDTPAGFSGLSDKAISDKVNATEFAVAVGFHGLVILLSP